MRMRRRKRFTSLDAPRLDMLKSATQDCRPRKKRRFPSLPAHSMLVLEAMAKLVASRAFRLRVNVTSGSASHLT